MIIDTDSDPGGEYELVDKLGQIGHYAHQNLDSLVTVFRNGEQVGRQSLAGIRARVKSEVIRRGE